MDFQLIFTYSLLYLLLVILHYILLKPLAYLFYIKYKNGDEVEVNYYPLFGVIKEFTNTNQIDALNYFKQLVKNNPKCKVLISYFAGRLFFMFIDTEFLKEYCIQNSNYWSKQCEMFSHQIFFQKGLVFTQGHVWQRQRKLISQSFTFDNLSKRIPIIKNICEQIITSFGDSKEEISLLQEMSKITSGVVFKMFFGNKLAEEKIDGIPLSLYLQQINNEDFIYAKSSSYYLLKSLFFGFKFAQNKLFSSYEKKLREKQLKLKQKIVTIVNQKIEYYKKKIENKQEICWEENFLAIYLKEYIFQTEEIITKEEIVHQFFTFIIGGMDTTAHLATMCIICMGMYPEVQQKLEKEINENAEDLNTLNHLNINQLDYMHKYIKEVLRLYSPAPVNLYRVCQKEHYMKQFKIPKGSFSTGLIGLNCFKEEYFKDCLEFKPERWEENLQIEQFAYIPFFAGPRNCIGQNLALIETKVILCFILKMYFVKLRENREQQKFIVKFLYGPKDDKCIEFVRKS